MWNKLVMCAKIHVMNDKIQWTVCLYQLFNLGINLKLTLFSENIYKYNVGLDQSIHADKIVHVQCAHKDWINRNGLQVDK